MPLQMTDHPTQPNEFYALYARAVFDVLCEQSLFGMMGRGSRRFAKHVQKLAIERALKEIGYFIPDDQSDVWMFRQAGYSGSLPTGWTKLPVDNFAQKIADAGINMLNERCRVPDVQKVERI